MRSEDSFLLLDRQAPLTVARVFVDRVLTGSRLVFRVPIQTVVQKALVCAQKERAASASHIQDAERWLVFVASQLGRAPPRDLPADGVPNDVFNNVGRGIVDSAGFAYFGLFFNSGLVPGRKPDHLSQKPLINGSEYLDGHDAEVIRRTVGKIQALQDRLENLVVHGQLRCDPVGIFRYAAFLLKMKQA